MRTADERQEERWGVRLWRRLTGAVPGDPAPADDQGKTDAPGDGDPNHPAFQPWASGSRHRWDDPGPSPWDLPSAAVQGESDQIAGPDGSLSAAEQERRRNEWAKLPKAERHRRLRGGA